MGKITIIGSGPSGVHFALSLLTKGLEVEMIDVGFSGPSPVNPGDNFNELKENLDDPVKYFLGENFEAVVGTDSASVYEFPPHKQYIFKYPENYNVELHGFEPHLSFARGGLAEAWTGGSYSFNDHDLEDFPFGYSDIEPYYNEISARIGLIGVEDDLSRFFPYHKNLSGPLELDKHSQLLFDKYEKKRAGLNKEGMYLGRSRIATLSSDLGERKKCDYSGRCQWGCPSDSLYVPSITLKECLSYKNFKYISGILVEHFIYDNKNKITAVAGIDVKKREKREFKVETLALAAGTIASSKIFLESFRKKDGRIVKLPGLMDNRQILAPFINLKMIGKQFEPESYQYHQLAVGIDMDNPREYIHGQITTLKTGMMQPPFQSMPLDFRTGIYLGRHLHSSLGVVNVNLFDTRREDNYLTLGEDTNGSSRLVIRYNPPENEKNIIKFSLKKMGKFFGKLGAIMPKFQVQLRPMGASVHYSGTIPMSENGEPFTVDSSCRSNDFSNLYIVDGSTFPFLPAKNLTFTLMANAARIADTEF
ncbi:MAG: GMC oxidoreductase [Acidobacteriota bacterium]